jgi:hypothetical protein
VTNDSSLQFYSREDELTLDAVLFLEAYKSLPLLRNIEKRIAKWTQLPVENGEHFYLQKMMEGALGQSVHHGMPGLMYFCCCFCFPSNFVSSCCSFAVRLHSLTC